jgi:hypothetical protein
MTVKLPYMVTPGVIPKVLTKIREARRTDRFTQDYLETMLGIRGGNARAVIPLLKRMSFLSADGTPTTLYDKYRNDDTRAVALAEGIRKAYDEVFNRNQFAFNLPRDKFTSLVNEITGLERDSVVGKAVVGTFFTLKDGADFESKPGEESVESNRVQMPDPQAAQPLAPPASTPTRQPVPPQFQTSPPQSDGVEFRVGYTINLNLPETTNPDVFNAIFKSLKEHLLRN